jgi:hypothetical protein
MERHHAEQGARDGPAVLVGDGGSLRGLGELRGVGWSRQRVQPLPVRAAPPALGGSLPCVYPGARPSSVPARASVDAGVAQPAMELSQHEGYISCIRFRGHDDAELLTASGDGRVIVWDIAKRVAKATLAGHEMDVMSASYIEEKVPPPPPPPPPPRPALRRQWRRVLSVAPCAERHRVGVV